MNNLNFEFPPDLNPQVYAFLAVIIGAACANNLTPLEQNSLGNWLTLLGQYLETTGAQQQLIENRKNQNMNYNSKHYSNSHFYNFYRENFQNEIDFLHNAVKKMQEELANLKKR